MPTLLSLALDILKALHYLHTILHTVGHYSVQQENIWILTKDCSLLKGIGRYVKSFKLWGTEKDDTGSIEEKKPELPASTIELQR